MFIARLIHRIGFRHIMVALLLVIATATLTAGLAGLVKGVEEGVFWLIGVAGLAAGWLLARSRMKGFWAAILGIPLGILMLVYMLADLSSPLWAITRSLVFLANHALRQEELGPPDPTPLLLANQELVSRLNSFVTHLYTWWNGLIVQQPVFDRVALTLLWGVLIWLVTLWAAWAIYRRHLPLHAIIPMAAVLAIMLNYTRGNANLMLPIVLVSLSLMGLVSFDNQQKRWITSKVDYAEDVVLDASLAIFFLTITLTTASALTPSLSIRQIIRFGQRIYLEFQGDTEQVAESLGVSPQTQPNALDDLNQGGLPRQHMLNSGPDLSQIVVMTVKTNDLPPLSVIEAASLDVPTYYWRGITYDGYLGSGWESSFTLNYVYNAGEPALLELPPASSNLRIVNQQVEYAQDVGGILYTAGDLVTVDHRYKVAWRLPIEQGADAYGSTIESQSYRAQSLLASPSIHQLQQAGEEYPDWIEERYLQIPDSVPTRVRRLASELTAGAVTPYDKAQAIETYLRSFPYNLEVPAAPAGQDVADYFLFDLQEGYCDYYATAMVVLARLSGLPARLAVGYATGEYDPVNARYVVTEANAHSWPEIYFPDIGWVAFEPTAGLPPIDRSTQDLQAINLPDLKPAQGFSLLEWLRTFTWYSWVKFAVWLLVAALLVWLASDFPRLRRKPPAAAIGHLYLRLLRRTQRLAHPLTGDTPYEFNARMHQRVDDLPGAGYSLLAPTLPDVERLADLYAHAAYSPVPPDRFKRSLAIRSWQNIRLRLWLADNWLKIRARFSRK
jgi:transglutaminase-like putative cysteine protease